MNCYSIAILCTKNHFVEKKTKRIYAEDLLLIFRLTYKKCLYFNKYMLCSVWLVVLLYVSVAMKCRCSACIGVWMCVCVWLVHAWRALVCAMVVAFVGVHDVHDGRIACVCCVLVWICDTRCVHIGMGMFAMLLYWLSVGVGCRSVGNHAQTRTFTFWLGSNRMERTSCVFRLCEWPNWIAYLIEILLGYFWLVVW